MASRVRVTILGTCCDGPRWATGGGGPSQRKKTWVAPSKRSVTVLTHYFLRELQFPQIPAPLLALPPLQRKTTQLSSLWAVTFRGHDRLSSPTCKLRQCTASGAAGLGHGVVLLRACCCHVWCSVSLFYFPLSFFPCPLFLLAIHSPHPSSLSAPLTAHG
jgi:hypothetical protein